MTVRLGGSTYFSNTSKPSLPSNVQSLVSLVGGLTDRRPKPMNVRDLATGLGTPNGPEFVEAVAHRR